MLTIDGSLGEGGGQVLRTSLALSLVTGQPFHMEGIRAGRRRPGLLRQHLTAVHAARTIGAAQVEGDEFESTWLQFMPGGIVPGEHHFEVGTAGSAILVLQAILPPLLLADGPSHLILEGGTHNMHAPPFEFLKHTWLPVVSRMGPGIEADLVRHGFYPAGGGRLELRIEPVARLSSLELCDRGSLLRFRARALVSNLPMHIAKRELKVVCERLNLTEELCSEQEVQSDGPGNVLMVEVESAQVHEVFSGFGRKGVRAEEVAEEVVREVRRFLSSGAPVGSYLADQLLLPMALAGFGRFRTNALTPHTTTNMEVIRQFLQVQFETYELGSNCFEVLIQEEDLSLTEGRSAFLS